MICADSSFVVSRYVQDAHSAKADRMMQDGSQVSLHPLSRAEMAHALYQYVFREKISNNEAQFVWDHFAEDCAEGIWILIDLPQRTWETSIRLARKYGSKFGIRTLDSLHVACALELEAERFWTFDERQARLAKAVGLKTSL
jgi:predicted nucleic acid-binding protein